MESTFNGITRTLPVRVDDLDGAGLLYHGRYVSLADHAISDFWHDAGWDFAGPFQPVVRALTLEYLAPVTSVGPLDVRIAIIRRGTTSVTYAFEFVRDDVVRARGERTMVFVDREGSPTRIPDGVWTMAQPLLAPAPE